MSHVHLVDFHFAAIHVVLIHHRQMNISELMLTWLLFSFIAVSAVRPLMMLRTITRLVNVFVGVEVDIVVDIAPCFYMSLQSLFEF